MDYKRIIFFGIVESHSQENRIQYLKRKYKDAEGEHYTVSEFFNGCINAINLYESEISNEIWYWRKDHTDMLKRWEDNNHDAIRKQNAIKKLSEKLSKLDVKTYNIKVELSKTNNEIKKTTGYISNNDLNTMRKSIEEVRSNLEPKKETKTSIIEPLDFNLNQTDIVHFFDLLADAGVIKEPSDSIHKTPGGFYGKLSQYFTAKGKKINSKSAKTIISNKKNNELKYSTSYYQLLEDLKKTIDKKLTSKS